MLTDEEQLAFRDSFHRIRRVAAQGLRQTDDAGRAIEFVANLHRGLDEVAARATEGGLVPECQAGCAHCCYVRVEATDPEVLRIARRVRQLPAAQLADLVERLRRAGDTGTRQGCAFLVGGRCSIYEIRPAACRKAHSLSARQCEALAPKIPQNLGLLVEAEALIAGTTEAYREVKLPASPHELTAAVLATLIDASAEGRWYNGEAVF